MNKGVLIVISGPSGCGKGTVLSHLMQNEGFCYSVSATTRAPRAGEVDGQNYFYLSEAEFINRLQSGLLLEHTVYCGNFYGTPKEYVEKCLDSGKNVVLEIETEGAFNVRKVMPEAFLVFIAPPDMETLEARLRGRGTEDEATVNRRLEKAKEEMALMPQYDFSVINRQGYADVAAKQILDAVNERRKNN